MDQIHKRFTTEQVRAILKAYCQGALDRSWIEEMLGISKTRFFALVKEYRRDPIRFSVDYQRLSLSRLAASVESAIERELMRDRSLIEDPSLPITSYNYSAIRDRLAKGGINVALSTIIDSVNNREL